MLEIASISTPAIVLLCLHLGGFCEAESLFSGCVMWNWRLLRVVCPAALVCSLYNLMKNTPYKVDELDFPVLLLVSTALTNICLQ